MRALIRSIGTLAILLLAAGPAAAASDVVKGSELVIAKDLAASTLLIGDQVFHVGAATRIEMDGARIQLRDVPVAREGDGTPVSEMRWGRYEARKEPSGLELLSLELVEVPL